MNLNRNHLKLALAAASAVVITSATGITAFALAGAPFADSGTDAGNSQPIDDNHAPSGHRSGGHGADDATPEPSESADDRTASPRPAASADRRGRGADDPADHDANDDKGGLRDRGASDDATPEPSESPDDSGHHSGGDDSNDRSGSNSGPGSGSGSGSGGDDDGGHHGGGDDSGSGGHGSDD